MKKYQATIVTQVVGGVAAIAFIVLVALLAYQVAGQFLPINSFFNKSQQRMDHMPHKGFHDKMESRYRRDLNGNVLY